jgi:hypothetical protein
MTRILKYSLTAALFLSFLSILLLLRVYQQRLYSAVDHVTTNSYAISKDTQQILKTMKDKGFDRLIKSTNYPPKTDREIAQWEWIKHISDLDPSYNWKMPITFFGKVVDEFDQPIHGASAFLMWTISQETPSRTILTDERGHFEINNIVGKMLTVRVNHTNYYGSKNSYQVFEYANFMHLNFHSPDSNNPVVFQLKKKGPREPMYRWDYRCEAPTNGQLIWLDIAHKRAGETGDFGVSYKRHAPDKGWSSDFTVTLIAAPGAGLLLSDEEFMFEAPTQGYQTMYTLAQIRTNSMRFSSVLKPNFYLRTAKGNHAVVMAEISQYNVPGGKFDFIIYHNPSGSRNLEYDDKLRIED